MARSKAATRKAKAAYSRKWRASADGARKALEYNRKTVDERASRNRARAEMVKKVGKRAIAGKDIHHSDSNPTNNSRKNLRVVKGHHEGGAPGNKNAKKKRVRR